MNIGETIEAQNKTIITLQTQNAELVKKIAELQKFNQNVMMNADTSLIRLRSETEELKKEVQKLQGNLNKFAGAPQTRSRDNIDAGIGHIGYSCSGSIDLLELMETLKSVIKSNGVRDTIRILAMAV